MNHLQVVKEVSFGLYLDAGEEGTILLPQQYVPSGCAVDDWLDVFVYTDSEDLPIATTLQPKAMVGECALLEVVDLNDAGAFLDWGLAKDLLVPYNEMQQRMRVGHAYVVYLYLDNNSGRVVATARLSRHLSERGDGFKPGQPVELQIASQTELGFKAVINGTHLGLLYHNELAKPLRPGQRCAGHIKAVRSDGKIDLRLQRATGEEQTELGDRIIAYLQQHDGRCGLTDKSPPEQIYDTFGVSKARYKRALGSLYKQRRILIEKDQITLQ